MRVSVRKDCVGQDLRILGADDDSFVANDKGGNHIYSKFPDIAFKIADNRAIPV